MKSMSIQFVVLCLAVGLLAGCGHENSMDAPEVTPSVAAPETQPVPPTATPNPEKAVLAITGPIEVVYDWSEDRCAPDDVPDMALRPFVDANGSVQANRSWPANRRFEGPTLDTIEPLCDITYQSHNDPDPANFRFHEWLQAVYTEDGETVYAVIHNEHNSWDFGDQGNTYYQNMTFALSTDGGLTYQAPEPPDNFIGASPYPYQLNLGLYGLSAGSNIIQGPDGAYYMLVLHWVHGENRQVTCLFRSDDLADPAAWRAWDGEGFNMTMVNPYLESDFDPTEHSCPPVDDGVVELGNMYESLIYNTYLDRYVVVTLGVNWENGRDIWGINYSFSEDLINWSPRVFLEELVLGAHTGVGGPPGAGYLVLLDPDSDSRNFETADKDAYIYFSRINNTEGISNLDFDLVRFPVEFFLSREAARAADVRTNLDVDAKVDGQAVTISGRLTDYDGDPIPNADIQITGVLNDNVGQSYQYSVTEVVPTGADTAFAGFRVNTECSCAGDSEFFISEISYTENGGGNRVANPTFTNRLSSYNTWGSGDLLVETDPVTGQRSLHVTATQNQVVGFFSNGFAVTPGAAFTYTVTSRVLPGSQGSGFFGLFFAGDTPGESMRITIPISPAGTQLGAATTGADGRFEFGWEDPTSTPYLVEVEFPGDATYWPSSELLTIRFK